MQVIEELNKETELRDLRLQSEDPHMQSSQDTAINRIKNKLKKLINI